MPAPKKNQYWKARTTHGRDKIFETPQNLFEAACEYFQWSNDNPWVKNEFKEGKMRKIPTARPLTLTGLYTFLDIDRKTWDLYPGPRRFYSGHYARRGHNLAPRSSREPL
jgi:hypothetical protein